MKIRIINRIHLLAICLMGMATATTAFQFGDFTCETNTWGTHSIIITDYTGTGGDVVIPDIINGLPVTLIWPNAFYNRGNALTSVVIPDSVTRIGSYAFAYCSGLTNVVIGSGVTDIEDRAFSFCTGLLDIEIPDSVTYIGDYVFAYCSSLTNIVIPESVTYIGSCVFRGCSELTAITVHTNNPSYSSIDGVLLYTDEFYEDLTVLVQYPGGKMGSYTISDSVTDIGDAAFASCRGLTSIVIPDSVRYIGSGSIGGVTVFQNCSGLTTIAVDADNPWYSSVDGVLFSKDQTWLIQYPGGKTGRYTIPDSATYIDPYAFAYCSGLTNIVIPEHITYFDSRLLFRSCSALTAIMVDTNNPAYSSVDGVLFNKDQSWVVRYPAGKTGSYTIPDSITDIVRYAFQGCSGLTNIVIPDSVTGIGSYAFGNCSGLTNVVIPDSVTSIEHSAFRNCSGLTAITVDTNNPSYSSIAGVLFNKNQYWLIQYPGGKNGRYTIPDSVGNIFSYAFAYCSGLTAIVFTKGLNLEQDAFAHCSNLTGVYFKHTDPNYGYAELFRNSGLVTIYYLPDASGWGMTFDGRPTQLWNPSVQTSDGNFGVQGDAFGFNIAGHDRELVKIETCTNLTSGMWTPITTTNLTTGTAYLSDPDWINHPNRFYRLSMP